MRVGLVRHLKVTQPFPSGWVTARDLQDWRLRYDAAPVEPGQVAVKVGEWDRCYVSDMARAVVTAQAVYSGEAIQTALLREPEVREFQTGDLSLPFGVWKWILRLAWMTGHRSQRSARDEFTQRVRQVADLIESPGGDILLVSHAGMMVYLRAELLRRGFQGPKFHMADHGRLYVFER